jgi:rod shape-determining protein MreD
MTETIFKNIIRFITLVLLQVLILNNVQFSGYINPYLYVLFILLLPLNIENWILIILAFLLGLSVDIFSDTLGLHSAATVFMAFCRPAIIRLGYKKPDYETTNIIPSIKALGFRWFLTYAFILVGIHHFLLFYIEEFNFHDFFTTFFRTILSIIATLILIILSQFITYKKK